MAKKLVGIVPVHNLGASVKIQEVEPTKPPVVITLPGEIGEAAGLEDDFELTVVVGLDNIKQFLAGAPTKDKDGDPATYEGENAILLTF